MGKAGEKQKKKSKIKDKQQSERFKETAREVGADHEADAFDSILKRMGSMPTRKYEIFRHRIYNANALIKRVDLPFPSELDASEWKRLGAAPGVFPAAASDLESKGYHLYHVDMSYELGADDDPGPEKQ